jgi:hypothetical protein
LLASQFSLPQISRSSYGSLSSWYSLTHLKWCQRVDAFMQSTNMVTMSISLLYCKQHECGCWVFIHSRNSCMVIDTFHNFAHWFDLVVLHGKYQSRNLRRVAVRKCQKNFQVLFSRPNGTVSHWSTSQNTE